MKLVKIPIIITSVSVTFFLIQIMLGYTENYSFGQIVNRFYPCITPEYHSAPCYIVHEAFLFVILFWVFAISVVVISLCFLYRFYKKRIALQKKIIKKKVEKQTLF